MAIGSSASPGMPDTHHSTATQAAAVQVRLDSGRLESVVKAPRVGHKKSRKGCAQCKRRHVKCNEEAPCTNCVRHGVACSLAGGPFVPREDAKPRRKSTASSSGTASRTASLEAVSVPIISTASVPSPNPLQVLTGLIDRPSSSQEQRWQIDLQLMHHYMSHTKYVLCEHHNVDYIMRIWTEELPALAFDCDYILHMLLALTALHKAYIEPGQAGYLQSIAVDHLDKALVLYGRDRGFTTVENANPKFCFAWLITLFAYAVPASVPPIDAMVELVLLGKCADAVLSDGWLFVAEGPFAPILTRGWQESVFLPTEGSTYALPEGMDFGLGHLEYMIGSEPMLQDDRRTCLLVLAELKTVYDTLVQTQGSCSVATMLCFPKQDCVHFAELVRRREPQALIILAYYCVLLQVLDNRWWVSGWAFRVLTDISGALNEHWKHWIEWPIEHVIMRQAPVVATSLAEETAALEAMLV